MIVERAPGMPVVVRSCASLLLIVALVVGTSVASGQAVVSPERLRGSEGATPGAASAEAAVLQLRQPQPVADRLVMFDDTRSSMSLSEVREEPPQSLASIAMPLIVALGLSMLGFLVMAATGGFRTASAQRGRSRRRSRVRRH